MPIQQWSTLIMHKSFAPSGQTAPAVAGQPPFDSALLDRLMEAAGLDLLLATSKHNVQYLLGGHRAMFFDYMDAMGVSRYLPVVIYPRGAASLAGYVGHRTESHQNEVAPLWIEGAETTSWGSVDAIEKAIAYARKRGLSMKRIGIESAFLPFDSAQALTRLAPESELVDALDVLERLRACKNPSELLMLREASERVTAAMADVIEALEVGMTKRQIVEALRQAETDRGLTFEYCLLAAGTSYNRAPSEQRIASGDVMSIDSGANFRGYIGDIARMAIVGPPDDELVQLLGFIEDIQQAAIKGIRPGAMGAEVYSGPQALMDASPLRDSLHFVGHGMGLVTHEVPHLTTRGPVPYSDADARLPLEPGMVLSIETTLRHPTRGFIKLEDTVAVTESGGEVFGNVMRGWNRAGTRTDGVQAA
jgi:Xaa-Pro aminopeptidase